MKLVSFNDYQVGTIDGDHIVNITEAIPSGLDSMPQFRMNWLIEHWATAQAKVKDLQSSGTRINLSAVKLLTPVPKPPHVFAAPANYRKHIGELGSRSVSKGRSAREQGFFLKAPGSVTGPADAIELPHSGRRFDHESELAVIIGKHGRNIPRAEAFDYVFGYSCLIDATMRIEPGVAEEERSMRKSFLGFTPVGPYLVTKDEVPNPQELDNRLWVNDDLRQSANTRDMIVGIAELIELISSVLPIQPGDIIASGTPEGVGPITVGDTVKISIDGVGEMEIAVRRVPAASPWKF